MVASLVRLRNSRNDAFHKLIKSELFGCIQLDKDQGEWEGGLQGWIKCGSGEQRSQEMTRKIEEIVILGYEEKEKRKEEGREEQEKKKRRKKEEVEN